MPCFWRGRRGGKRICASPNNTARKLRPLIVERAGDAHRRDQDAADDRAEDARQVQRGRIQRDRVLQVLTRHELGDQRLAGRQVERQHDAAPNRDQQHHPDLDQPVETRIASTSASSMAIDCVVNSSQRRSNRSATTPPTSVNTKIGASRHRFSSARLNAEPVRS